MCKEKDEDDHYHLLLVKHNNVHCKNLKKNVDRSNLVKFKSLINLVILHFERLLVGRSKAREFLSLID